MRELSASEMAHTSGAGEPIENLRVIGRSAGGQSINITEAFRTSRDAGWLQRQLLGLPDGHVQLFPDVAAIQRTTTIGPIPSITYQVTYRDIDCGSCHNREIR